MSCNTCELPPFHSQYLLQQEILSHMTSSSHPGWVPCAVLISSCWTCLTFSESIYITCQKAAGTVSSHLHGTQLCRDRGHDFYNRKIVFSLQRKNQQKTFMLKGKPKQGVVADVRQWYTPGNSFAKSTAMVRVLQGACVPGATDGHAESPSAEPHTQSSLSSSPFHLPGWNVSRPVLDNVPVTMQIKQQQCCLYLIPFLSLLQYKVMNTQLLFGALSGLIHAK